jgi:3-methyladenine DNA glycosylase AlkD
MPRNGRIRIVGKREAREVEMRADELRELARELRRQRREKAGEFDEQFLEAA